VIRLVSRAAQQLLESLLEDSQSLLRVKAESIAESRTSRPHNHNKAVHLDSETFSTAMKLHDLAVPCYDVFLQPSSQP